MAIVAGDIKTYLSGGSGNTDPNASIGGVRSTTAWAGGSLHDLFDVVSGAENAASDVEYRCIYVRNEHGSLTAQNIKMYLSAETAGGASLALGAGAAAVNATETAVADENTAPASVTFTAPTTDATGIALPDLAPNAFKAIWIRRTAANTGAVNADGGTISFALDTAA